MQNLLNRTDVMKNGKQYSYRFDNKNWNELRTEEVRKSFEGIKIEERKEAMLENLKERLEQTEESQQPQKVEIFNILMSEKRNWLSQIRRT